MTETICAGDCPDWKAHEGLWTSLADIRRHLVDVHGWPAEKKPVPPMTVLPCKDGHPDCKAGRR